MLNRDSCCSAASGFSVCAVWVFTSSEGEQNSSPGGERDSLAGERLKVVNKWTRVEEGGFISMASGPEEKAAQTPLG